jgi:hypothetical protein
VREKFMWLLAAGYVLVKAGWIVVGAAGTTNWVQVAIGVVWMIGGFCWWLGLLRRRRRQRSAVTGRASGS